MKASLLLLLLLPLHSFAQYRSPGMQMQQNQQSRQDFNRMTNQRTQEFMNRQSGRSYSAPGMVSSHLTQETKQQAQATQKKSEQEANESLSRLAQEQQRKRQEHPAKNAQMAATQQKADDKQLTVLAVKNYRDVFLPAQVANALEAQQLSARAQKNLKSMNDNLLADAWWNQQEGTQLAGKIKVYSDSLTVLTAGLLGFDPASPPAMPASLSASSLDEKLTKDAFDPNAAAQLLRDAALTERLAANDHLATAVKEFSAVAASASGPEFQNDSKKLRKEVQKSLRNVNKEMERYNARIASSDKVYSTEKALRKSTSNYLAKNGSK